MGSLQSATITRLHDDVTFEAWAWSADDGTYEVFWHENGNRMNFHFNADGVQLGTWNRKYVLGLQTV